MKTKHPINWPVIGFPFIALFALLQTWGHRNLELPLIILILFQNLSVAGLVFIALRSSSLWAIFFSLVYVLANTYGYILSWIIQAFTRGLIFHTNSPDFHWWTYPPNVETMLEVFIICPVVIAVFGVIFQRRQMKKAGK